MRGLIDSEFGVREREREVGGGGERERVCVSLKPGNVHVSSLKFLIENHHITLIELRETR